MGMYHRINDSTVTEFILMGLSARRDLQIGLFPIFLIIYLFTILGNTGIIFLVCNNSRLRTPMYFFICSLSFLDLCYSSDITPKMIVDLLYEKKTISYIGCAIQLFFFCAFGTTECWLFAVMAYDRHVAICNPLNYNIVMRSTTCILLVYGAYTIGFVHALIEICFTFHLYFCASNIVYHFVCDFPPLLSISCTDTSINELILYIFASSVTMISLFIILMSYFAIFLAILEIKHIKGRKKAFSTCSSHIIAASVFYCTVLFVYLTPKSKASGPSEVIATVIYTAAIPMVNPIIYSFRNKDIKVSIKITLQNSKVVFSNH
ncbi:olfactory receptor 5G9-like [Pelobates fuscus]|uniref:olfactory receptor 5G9-like n=1 Tax=Pelobates fuscus TaxID=191477 RepID=UPI002FE4E88B